MDTLFVGIFLPHIVVRLHIDALQAVPGDDIKFPDGIVVLRRVARCHHNPTVRHPMPAEDLVLQKLQHGRSQSLGHTVDLIKEQNALFQPRTLHHIIDGCDDLRHGILGHAVLHTTVDLLLDKRQTQSALSGMMGHGIADKAHPKFCRHLLHNGSLTDTGRAHQKDGPLPLDGN